MDDRYYPGLELEAMQAAVHYCAWIAAEIDPYVQGRCLEVGAGRGTISRLLVRSALRSLWCLEPSINLIPQLQTAVQASPKPVTVIDATLDEFAAAANERFESIVCINVLEHIVDDQKAMQQMNALLSPGGSLCIYVPALPGIFGAMDVSFGHHRRYTRARLQTLAQQVGLRIEKLRFLNCVGVIPWWLLGKVLRRSTFTRSQAVAYDRLVIPAVRYLEGLVSPPFGQNLLLIAKQTRDKS